MRNGREFEPELRAQIEQNPDESDLINLNETIELIGQSYVKLVTTLARVDNISMDTSNPEIRGEINEGKSQLNNAVSEIAIWLRSCGRADLLRQIDQTVASNHLMISPQSQE